MRRMRSPATDSTRIRLFAFLVWGTLAFTLLVILWGAFVRATGSGAGCGNHWPLCNGEMVPRSAGSETLIEFTHRATSGLAFLMVLGIAFWAFRLFPRGNWVRRGAFASLAFMIGEALLGAGLVILGLVGDNTSFTRAWVMAFHLANTFILIGCLALTGWWASFGPPARFGSVKRQWLLPMTMLAGLLIVGMSGAVAALGDTLFPSDSLAEALEQDFSSHAHLLIRLRIYHPMMAVLAGLLVLWNSVQALQRSQSWIRRSALLTAGLYIAQLGAGITNALLLAPVWMQMVHLLLADLIWISAVILSSYLVTEPHEVSQEFPSPNLGKVQSSPI